MRIVIDAMGGDLAPQSPVAGAIAFANDHRDIQLTLVGREDALRSIGSLPPNVDVVHAPDVIETGEEPVRAVRRKTESSMVAAARMVKDGQADAMVSAGNTGAIVASGLLVIGRMPGMERPALAPVLPTFAGHGVLLLDAGATMDASSSNLVQYAVMGSVYAKYVLGVDRPRVGLINVGSEEGKGNAVTKDAHALLKAAPVHFVGNVESRELLDGVVDVAVCDGFVGNVVLKLVEGVGLGLFQAMKEALTAGLVQKAAAALLKPSLRALRDRFDYAEYGGAPFLGVAGGCFKAHGSSNARAWYTALLQASAFVRHDVLNHMTHDLQQVPSASTQ